MESIDPSPTRIKRVELKPLVLVIPLGSLSLTCFVLAMVAFWYDKVWSGLFTMGVILALVALPFVLIIRNNSVNALLFTGWDGIRLPLWYNNPAPETFENFSVSLKEAINAVKRPSSDISSLAAQIQNLKKLVDEGVLTSQQFEAAKNKLTGNETSTRIGF